MSLVQIDKLVCVHLQQLQVLFSVQPVSCLCKPLTQLKLVAWVVFDDLRGQGDALSQLAFLQALLSYIQVQGQLELTPRC